MSLGVTLPGEVDVQLAAGLLALEASNLRGINQADVVLIFSAASSKYSNTQHRALNSSLPLVL